MAACGPCPTPPAEARGAQKEPGRLRESVASPLFQELSGDTTSTRSEMNSARLERNKAARTVTATTSTRAKGAAMIAGAARRRGGKADAEEPLDPCATSVVPWAGAPGGCGRRDCLAGDYDPQEALRPGSVGRRQAGQVKLVAKGLGDVPCDSW